MVSFHSQKAWGGNKIWNNFMTTRKKKGCGCGRKRKSKQATETNTVKKVTNEKEFQNKVFKKIILKNGMSPGDIVMLSATVRDLKKKYSDLVQIDVKTSCSEIWENNPYLTKLSSDDEDVIEVRTEYPLIHKSNYAPYHFIHGFAKDLENKLGLSCPITEFKGDIHLSDKEKAWISQVEELDIKDDFWLVFAGGKYDFSAKWVNPDVYQEVIDHFKGKITFVQVGQKDHWHVPLKNCINLVGKTNLRQLIRLTYHSVGVLGPVSFGMHAAAAVPVKPGRPKNRAGVIVAGGREPMQWEAYGHHRFLSNNGALPCCDNGGCWKSRCTKIKDNDDKNNDDKLCLYPITISPKANYPKDKIDGELKIAKCIDMIKPRHIIDAIESYYIGGALQYGSSIPDKISEKSKKYIELS